MDERYISQINLEQIGSEGQKKLAESSVILIGAGGLGSPVLTYLAAAGVGHIGVIDPDIVSKSNLNRQFLYSEKNIGQPKAKIVKKRLEELNSEIEIINYIEKLTDENAKNILIKYNLVIGAVDSFETRFIINKAIIELGLPYIDGGANGFNGFVIFINPPETPCLNCVFGNKNKNNSTGILGTTAGIIGTLEANLALIWLLGLGNKIKNKILLYDGLRLNIDLIDIKRDKNCLVCGGDF